MTKSSEVKRYDMFMPSIESDSYLGESDDGDYVRYEDYLALQTRCEAAERATQAELQHRESLAGMWSRDIEQLTAERDKLRVEVIAAINNCGDCAVHVREGGGPDNIEASLAVSIANLVKAKEAAERDAARYRLRRSEAVRWQDYQGVTPELYDRETDAIAAMAIAKTGDE